MLRPALRRSSGLCKWPRACLKRLTPEATELKALNFRRFTWIPVKVKSIRGELVQCPNRLVRAGYPGSGTFSQGLSEWDELSQSSDGIRTECLQ